MMPLSEQRVVISGAAQGLGAAIARHFASAGAELALIDKAGDRLDQVNRQIGGGAQVVRADLGDSDQTTAAIKDILHSDRRIDTLVHNAAILVPEPLPVLSLPMFQATVNVALQGGYQLARAAWPWMSQNGGALIFVSSQSGIKGFAGESAYCAAKHGLEGFAKSLAIEGMDSGIVACAITPGKAMRTPMSERNYPPELRAVWIEPDVLVPAFVTIAESRDPGFNGQRLNAWSMVSNIKATP